MSLRPAAAAVLALADQRLPAGGHVHSGGVEQAVALFGDAGAAQRRVHDARSLAHFLSRRLSTVGLVTGALAAAAATAASLPDAAARIARLADEADARTPSPAQREASRAQGRGLLRLARAAWPAPGPDLAWTALGPRPHHPLVLGCAVAAAGAGPLDAALVAAYCAVTGPATAAQRLLGLDPTTVAVITFQLGPQLERLAAAAAAAARGLDGPGWAEVAAELPDDSDPLFDLLAEQHASRQERLFVS
jgi:urease accessory protein